MLKTFFTFILAGFSLVVISCGENGEGAPDAGCEAPQRLLYTVPGCGTEAKPVCQFHPDAAAIAITYCGCAGATFVGGQGYAEQPYRALGPCGGDGGAGRD